MAEGRFIEKRGHVVGFKEEISNAAKGSDDEFFTWFETARDKDSSFIRGSWDFSVHIAAPAARFLSSPEDKVALEIGHGGGRMLAAASRHFGSVIGIDVHDNNEKVAAELNLRGIHNFRLVRTEGSGIPLEDASVDCVYSFIVLQHVEKIGVFNAYLTESYRVLRPGGIAVLYFGRKRPFTKHSGSRILYLADRLAEAILLWKGYEELPARVNMTNLRVSLGHARSLSRKAGFEVLSSLVSRGRVPEEARWYGPQHGLILGKR